MIDRVVVPEGGFVGVYVTTNATEETTTVNGGTTTAAGETTTAAATATVTETIVPGGVATQEYVADELAGNSTYLEPGVHQNVTVQLNRTLNESQVLVAMPHRDTNGNQQYDFPAADEPYGQPAPLSDWAFVTLEGDANQTTTATGTVTTTTTEGS